MASARAPFASDRAEPPRPLFTFAVLGDTHIQPEGDPDALLWPVYGLANDRARHVVATIEQARPAFVVHQGDMIHPLPGSSGYAPAAEAARAILGRLSVPLHTMPGNHDLGDKPLPTMPGSEVDAAGLALYQEHFGARFSAFDHEGCRFVLIDSPSLNAGLPEEAEQRAWLEAELEAAHGKRIFLFSHYPLYILHPDEPPNYDNIDEPARSWLLGLILRHRVEAVFSGHVHNFFWHRQGVTDLYLLPATSFFRQDFGEMFRVPPQGDYGRADAGKLGFAFVDVHEDGHVVRLQRTEGRMLEDGAALPYSGRQLRPFHPRERMKAPVGVHLRHPWAEVTTLPYNGPLDEFLRKRARNDHAVKALWEHGIRDVRVPLDDLVDPAVRDRMVPLAEGGHRFHLFRFGLPSPEEAGLLAAHADLASSLEVALAPRDMAAALPELTRLRRATGLPIHLSRIETAAHTAAHTHAFVHLVTFGFRLGSPDLDDLLAQPDAAALDALVFRVALDEDPVAAIADLARFARERGKGAVANVRLASDVPTEFVDDDRRIAERVAQATVAAFAHPEVTVFLDTFVDHDRGNQPRHGLLDRRYNPRPAAHVLGHLQAALATLGPIAIGEPRTSGSMRLVPLEARGASLTLALPGASPGALPAAAGTVDLVTGRVLDRPPAAPDGPLLLVRSGRLA